MSCFDRVAADFDTDRRSARAEQIARSIRAYIAPGYTSAMDFGCGTGLIGMHFLGDFGRIEFVDPSEGMLKEVQRKIAGHKNATARTLSMPGGAVDFIFSSMVLHHIPDVDETLRFLAQSLKPGGKLVLVDLLPVDPRFHIEELDFSGHHGFSADDLCARMAREGFMDIARETIYQGVKPIPGGEVPYALFLLAGTISAR